MPIATFGIPGILTTTTQSRCAKLHVKRFAESKIPQEINYSVKKVTNMKSIEIELDGYLAS
jgi:hypothetical protein